ncbi:MAG TPA: amino acid adenylation domain-containing protein, partial [Pseudonocardiaceae bacterium]|nr:amino acid adenylation domain-containing protein [Pseudonocardiaceae bacterium]
MADDPTSRERLLARLLAERGIVVAAPATVPRRSPDAVVPLSGAQRGLWFTERFGLDAGAYVMQASLRLRGPFDVSALRRALTTVLARHEALRTRIVEVDGEPSQHAVDPGELPDVLTVVELTGGTEQDARRRAEAEVDRPFDLGSAPLVRCMVLALAAEDHVLLLTAHHIVCDDTSMSVLVDELGHCYGAFVAGRAPEQAEPAVRFGDFVLWQAGRLAAGERERQLDHWRQRLAGAPAVLDLATDRPRPAVRTVAGASHQFTVPAGVAARVTALRTATGHTLFTTLLAAYGVLLSRNHAGGAGTDVVVGAPTTSRPLPDLNGVVGMFVNTIALRLDTAGDPTVARLLDRARQVCTDALGNADVPFDQVAAATAGPRDPSHHPLFQVMLVLNQGSGTGVWAGLAAEPFPIGRSTSRFDLTLVIADTGAAEWPAVLDYSTELFDAATIARLADQFLAVLAAMSALPQARLSELDLRTEADRTAVTALNASGPPAAGHCVVEQIREQAARTPDAEAVRVIGGGALNYRELDERSNHLAHRLRSLGVGPETPVGIALPAGPPALVALLGVLKAGGAYLPLDPAHPPRRLAAVLADSGAEVLIATGTVAGFDGTVLDPAEGGAAAEPPALEPDARRLAYLIYTSGSTGAPKGVMVQHDTLRNLTAAFVARHGFAAGQRLLMIPPLSFDASVGDVFPALVSGATLVLHPEPAELDGPGLVRLCTEHGITSVDTAAALWRRWVTDLAGLADATAGCPLTVMMIGGEAAPAATVRSWTELTGGRIALFNHYGPTEATVCATTHLAGDPGPAGAALPIGRPLPGVRVYVLDAGLRPAPVGVPGELYIGGLAPARGYRGAPAETAAAFVPDPFTGEPGARMYRTGDLVRLAPEGVLEFAGRADEQVKIRGNRIEPAEVLAALAAHPAIAQAAVQVRPDQHGQPALVAFVVAAADRERPDAATLRAFCADRVPDYMLPAAYVWLAELPLTVHGKLDAAALPSALPDGAFAPEAAFVEPRTAVERTLAEIWSEVLGVPRIGRHDSFFALGGHSLLAAPVLAKVRRLLGVTLPLRTLFAAGDLAELAEAVEQAGHTDAASFAAAYQVAVPKPAQLHADATPPDDVVAAGPADGGPVRTVFLTGGTGFLGAHLLAELLAHTDAHVHCLVRADSPQLGTARLLANLR